MKTHVVPLKTIFDQSVSEALIARIHKLEPGNKALWGKMNIYQMLKHCRLWSDWIHGKGDFENHVYKQDFLGKLFGRMALTKTIKDDRPIGKNLPAGFLAVADKEKYPIVIEKDKWIQSIKDYENFSNDGFRHDFFGKMTREHIGTFVYKHFDHHLRQFGV